MMQKMEKKKIVLNLPKYWSAIQPPRIGVQ